VLRPSRILAALLVALGILEILSLTTADSPWPFAMLGHEVILLRVLGWFFTVQAASCVLGLFLAVVIPNMPCPICSKDLKKFAEVYGAPVPCSGCGKFSHSKCIKAKGHCVICNPDEEGIDRVLHDFAERFRK